MGNQGATFEKVNSIKKFWKSEKKLCKDMKYLDM